MSTALEAQEIELLCHKFGVPELVRNWLENTKNLDHEKEYVLHEDICNLHPEDALLCISLCLKSIQDTHKSPIPRKEYLNAQITEIIDNYGYLALKRLDHQPRDEDRVDIEFIAKDLTNLASLIEKIEEDLLESDDIELGIIMNGLGIQTGAQAEIARYVLASFREQEAKNKEFEHNGIPFMKTLPVNDNTDT